MCIRDRAFCGEGISARRGSVRGAGNGSIGVEAEGRVDPNLIEADDRPTIDLDHGYAHLAGPADEVTGGGRIATHVDVAEWHALGAQIGLGARAPSARRRGENDNPVRSAGRSGFARQIAAHHMNSNSRDAITRSNRSRASRAIGSMARDSTTLRIAPGSIASTIVRPSCSRRVTLHGSSAPADGSAVSARWASGGLHAPRIK